jgi:hypothetical protein
MISIQRRGRPFMSLIVKARIAQEGMRRSMTATAMSSWQKLSQVRLTANRLATPMASSMCRR